MSLFFMNRYLGEEEDGVESKESRSLTLLTKLKQKAKERQKQCVPETTPQSQDNTERVTSKKKRKKKGVVKSTGEEEEQKCDQDEDVVVKKRRKRKEPQQTDAQTDGDEGVVKQKEPTSETTEAPVGFTVLGGFLNKPVQKSERRNCLTNHTLPQDRSALIGRYIHYLFRIYQEQLLPQWLAQPDVIHGDIKTHLRPLSDVPGLCANLLKKLQNNHIQHFFPVQAEVIPAVLESAQSGLLVGPGGHRPRDLCVSAPTGSGKTLAFVIPIIQVLMQRVVCEVRALAVLPTKELAQQVGRVFSTYAEGTTLRVVLITGQKSFTTEQASLSEVRGGRRRSLADIVVATPGRLVDHINKNSGLSLEHLRFLIIDEADRMIDSMHQSWLSQVVKAVYASGSEANALFRRSETGHITAVSLSPPQVPLQKLLFSATLTHNPEKLQQLGLYQPRLFSSNHIPSEANQAPTQRPETFNFPQGLTEYYVPCTLSKKPLILLHFVSRMKLSPILCFTNSKEAAHRLVVLMQLFGGVQAAEFSSRLSPGERKKTLKDFEQGKIELLVSTDAAARGIDISGVKCVVNYDAPQFVRTYIHRIGRTARAGRAGLAFTFLLQVQEKDFLQMVSDAGSPGIQKQMVKPELLKNLEEPYEQALRQLAQVVKEEKNK